jgi:hypothetical protein
VLAIEKYTSLTGRPVKFLVPSNLKEWQSKSLSQLGYEGDCFLPFTPGTGYTSIKTRCVVASHSRCQKTTSARPAKRGIPFDAVSPRTIAELKERLSPKRSELRGSVLPKKIFLSRPMRLLDDSSTSTRSCLYSLATGLRQLPFRVSVCPRRSSFLNTQPILLLSMEQA